MICWHHLVSRILLSSIHHELHDSGEEVAGNEVGKEKKNLFGSETESTFVT